MEQSISTDKLAIVGAVIDKMLDKLPTENISKIKTLEIDWEEYGDCEEDAVYLPNLRIKFHE